MEATIPAIPSTVCLSGKFFLDVRMLMEKSRLAPSLPVRSGMRMEQDGLLPLPQKIGPGARRIAPMPPPHRPGRGSP